MGNLPSVQDFLQQYRYVYETSVKPYNRPLTEQAYQKLFDVANRTDDLIEAQIIMEKEHLVLNTVTADYKDIAKDFLEAADPNYEVTSASVKATMGTYVEAKSPEEIVYLGEIARATCDDIAVQIKLKTEMLQTLTALLFAWEHAKRKIREGESVDKQAASMVLTRRQTRKYYKFLSEDMGITFDTIEATPFYRILLLNPQGLDALWRMKKVMHPDNIRAMRYALFEEILSNKSMEEILMTPQPYPYYEAIDTNRDPDLDDAFQKIADDLNSDIKYFRENGLAGVPSQEELVEHTKRMILKLANSGEQGKGQTVGSQQVSYGSSMGRQRAAPSIHASEESPMPSGIGRSIAADAAKEIGKGLLRGLFRR